MLINWEQQKKIKGKEKWKDMFSYSDGDAQLNALMMNVNWYGPSQKRNSNLYWKITCHVLIKQKIFYECQMKKQLKLNLENGHRK